MSRTSAKTVVDNFGVPHIRGLVSFVFSLSSSKIIRIAVMLTRRKRAYCSGLWAMHFVGMLAMDIGIPIRFNVAWTVASALLAIVSTFGTFAAELLWSCFLSHPIVHKRQLFRRGLTGLNPRYERVECEGDGNDMGSGDVSGAGLRRRRASVVGTTLNGDGHLPSVTAAIASDVAVGSSSRPSDAANLPGDDPSDGDIGSIEADFPDDMELLPESSEPNALPAGLPSLSKLLHFVWTSYDFKMMAKSASLASLVCAMHYLGMFAMLMEGTIVWDAVIIAMSLLVAWFTCSVAFLFMPTEEAPFMQLAYSVLVGLHVSAVHYIGVMAGTFYTSLPPPYTNGGYPPYLPFSVTVVALMTCFVSYMLVAHKASQSRNRLREMILTKRKLWMLMAQKEAADRNNRIKMDFISVASHEIRKCLTGPTKPPIPQTPLHAIAGYAELLEQTAVTEEQQYYIDCIRIGCHTTQLITNNVLDFTKLERMNEETLAKPVDLDLRQVALNVVRSCASTQRKEVDFMLEVEYDVPGTMFLDELYVTRLLMNIVSNALKFTNEGFVMVSISVEKASTGPVLIMRVEDTGIGIPASFTSTVFEPFRQADTSMTRKHTGTGLGLAICKQLATRCNGTIDLESRQNVGSIFTTRIPIPETTSLANKPAPPPPWSLRPARTLALFCRHPRTQQAMTQLWQRHGYTIVDIDISPASTSTSKAAGALARITELRNADLVWADIEVFSTSRTLQSLVNSNVPLFISYHDSSVEMDPGLKGANVIGVKRPLIAHVVAEWMENPKERMWKAVRDGAATMQGSSLQGGGGSDSFVGMQLNLSGLRRPSWSKTASGTATWTPPLATATKGNPMDNVQRSSSFDGVGTGVPPAADPDFYAKPPEMDGEPNPGVTSRGNTSVSGENDAPEKTKQRPRTIPVEAPASDKAILLVEDNPTNQKLCTRILEKLGYQVELAENGQEALDKVVETNGGFRMILMDCQMPVMSGLESARRIRAFEQAGSLPHPPLPIIALTANVSAESQRECEEAGMDMFLPKPVTIARLREVIEGYVGKVGR
ncbi:hypothetical protein HK104_010840 [Borealophlyctis nickersoniae]|nr:hypothetical protein HK104_010840 [Borealophlyctis nickersoniae]